MAETIVGHPRASGRPRHRRAALPVLLWLAAAAAAQDPPAPGRVDDSGEARLAAAVDTWLASDQTDRALLDRTVAELLAQPAGFAWLAGQLPAARQQRNEPRSKGLFALVTHGSLEFLRRESTSGVVFAGQYDGLRALQPEVGDLLLGLLLDTPAWYPETHRGQLVPALRDLFPTGPAPEIVDRVEVIARNTEVEPDALRDQIACMLWQWGRREHAQARLQALLEASSEGDAEDRVPTLLALADLHYRLRDYRAAANVHLSAQALARASNLPLKPNDFYSAACVHALSGNLERGMAALARSVELHCSPDVDSSLKLAKVLFDRDPEIDLLRRDPRFEALRARAFPPETRPR